MDGSVFLGFGWNLPMVFPFKSAVLPWRWRRVASCVVIPPADLEAGPVEAACSSDPKGVRGGGASSVVYGLTGGWRIKASVGRAVSCHRREGTPGKGCPPVLGGRTSLNPSFLGMRVCFKLAGLTLYGAPVDAAPHSDLLVPMAWSSFVSLDYEDLLTAYEWLCYLVLLVELGGLDTVHLESCGEFVLIVVKNTMSFQISVCVNSSLEEAGEPFWFPHARAVPKRNNQGSLGIMNLEHVVSSIVLHQFFRFMVKQSSLSLHTPTNAYFLTITIHPPPLHYRRQVPSSVGQFRRRSWLRVKYLSRVLLLSCYHSY
ncbi:hypothetical protein DY000_02053770 [Brassica cretica]|uniref:Uncharacterized protein n=1 Tax=Brassica cretica TaxID=69181 RepID=A0ABQ7ALA7_BRACR|nr:hypothetical protein DY000_02053770 [Brassica cretica]